jgi:hypothetical protein
METGVINWGGLGFIVLTLVLGSLAFIILASILVGRKKEGVKHTNATAVFLSTISLVAGLFILGTWLMSVVLGLFLPS